MDFITIRHQLHQIAELSGLEFKTKSLILNYLESFSPDHIYTFPESNNIIAEYFFSENGKTLLFRCDMDAVPVREELDIEYKSKDKTTSHKCGHDGHVASMLSFAKKISSKPFKTGRILLLFQEGEELGLGAQRLIDSNFLNSFSIDEVYAFHNIPEEPLHSIIVKEGSFSCSVISCDIELHGKTSHAAEPQKGVSPLRAAETIVNSILTLNNPNLDDESYRVVTLIEMRIGEQAYGVAAGNGVLRFTIRTYTDQKLQELIHKIETMVHSIMIEFEEIQYHLNWLQYFAANNNNAEVIEKVKSAALANRLEYHEKRYPFSWGEDFGIITQKYKGAMFGIGSGENTAPLHHPMYDFPDSIIETATKMFYDIAKENLK
jgi:amidohydrolase